MATMAELLGASPVYFVNFYKHDNADWVHVTFDVWADSGDEKYNEHCKRTRLTWQQAVDYAKYLELEGILLEPQTLKNLMDAKPEPAVKRATDKLTTGRNYSGSRG